MLAAQLAAFVMADDSYCGYRQGRLSVVRRVGLEPGGGYSIFRLRWGEPFVLQLCDEFVWEKPDT